MPERFVLVVERVPDSDSLVKLHQEPQPSMVAVPSDEVELAEVAVGMPVLSLPPDQMHSSDQPADSRADAASHL